MSSSWSLHTRGKGRKLLFKLLTSCGQVTPDAQKALRSPRVIAGFREGEREKNALQNRKRISGRSQGVVRDKKENVELNK